MEDVYIVKCFETFNNLNKDPPNVFLFHVTLVFLVLGDALEEVSEVGKLHHDAARLGLRQSRTLTRETDSARQ